MNAFVTPVRQSGGFSRRAILLLPLAVAACGTDTADVQTSFRPLDFDYLTKLRLSVGSIDIGDTPNALGAGDLGFLSPVQPAQALRQMAEQRLVAGGGAGRAAFSIEQASLTTAPGLYVGNFAVRLDITNGVGTQAGFAEARVSRSLAARDDGGAAQRAVLYQLTRLLMADMNVEFEFQVRRSLKDYLQTTASSVPVPAAVEQQDLAPPPPPPP